MEVIELNRRWLSNMGFFPRNKDKLKDKTILIYCEDIKINGDDTINFFIKMCKSYITNINIKICDDSDLIEKFKDIDYYFFVNFHNYTILDSEKVYLLSIRKYNINDDVLFENITIINNNNYYALEFHNRMSRQRCFKEDCVEGFVEKYKELLTNKKILVYYQHNYENRLRPLFYFVDLIKEKINFDYSLCPNYQEFKSKLNDYDIIFIKEDPYYSIDENNKKIEDIEYIKKEIPNNKDLFVFREEYDFIEKVGLCEIIRTNYNNTPWFIRFINRIEDY